MSGYSDVFGGSTVQPADVQFSSVSLTANLVTFWPAYATTGQVLSRIMQVSASVAGLTVSLPDATLAGVGQDVLFDNTGSETFAVLDDGGGVVTTLAAGQAKYLYLSGNSTAAGTWRVTLFGVGSSALDAAALAGYGIKAISNTLNTAAVTTVITGDTTVVLADRSKVFVWEGANGTLTLPTTVGSTNDFAVEVRNQGSGTLTIAPVGGVLVDASSTITLSVQESCFVHMGATDWYTVGRGRNTAFNFTQLSKSIAGGTYVLTLTEASNVVQKYTGTLVSNATITLPAVVQVYYVSNATTGAYTLTFGCAGGGTSVAVTQAQAAILFCDGTNIINANTSLAGGISSIIFAAGSVTTPPVAIAEAVTGFYASGTHEIGATCNGVYVGKWTPTGFVAVGTLAGSNLSGTNTGDNAVNTLYSGLAASKQDAADKDASGGYAGLTLYKVNMKNAANTFTSYLTNTNTASRTYTFQDRDGTLADGADLAAKADLSGNTFTGAQVYSDQVLSRGMTKDMGAVFLDKGNSGTAAQALDYTAGSHQKLTVTGAFTLSTSNWPPTGNTGELLLELVNGASSVVTWPTVNWVKGDGTFTTTFASNGVTLQASGTDFCLLWSRDGGTTVYGKWMR